MTCSVTTTTVPFRKMNNHGGRAPSWTGNYAALHWQSVTHDALAARGKNKLIEEASAGIEMSRFIISCAGL